MSHHWVITPAYRLFFLLPAIFVCYRRLLEILLAATPNAGNGKDAAQQRKKEKKAARMIAEVR